MLQERSGQAGAAKCVGRDRSCLPGCLLQPAWGHPLQRSSTKALGRVLQAVKPCRPTSKVIGGCNQGRGPCLASRVVVSYLRGCCHAGTDSGDISAHPVQIRIRDVGPLRQIAGQLMQPATACVAHMVGPLLFYWPSALVCGLATGDVPSFETADDLVMGKSCGRNLAEGQVLSHIHI